MDTSSAKAKLLQRYKSAYGIVRTIGGISGIVMIVGFLAAGGVWLSLAKMTAKEDQINHIFPIGGAVLCIILFYCLHTIIAAVGQLLKAGLDTAVNTSPLLENEDRAKIMSL
jgi:hypothetical protein